MLCVTGVTSPDSVKIEPGLYPYWSTRITCIALRRFFAKWESTFVCTKVVIWNSWDCVGEEETQAQRARARRDNVQKTSFWSVLKFLYWTSNSVRFHGCLKLGYLWEHFAQICIGIFLIRLISAWRGNLFGPDSINLFRDNLTVWASHTFVPLDPSKHQINACLVIWPACHCTSELSYQYEWGNELSC